MPLYYLQVLTGNKITFPFPSFLFSGSFYFFFNYLLICLCVCVHIIWCSCGCQRTTQSHYFSPLTMWVLKFTFGPSDLMASIITHSCLAGPSFPSYGWHLPHAAWTFPLGQHKVHLVHFLLPILQGILLWIFLPLYNKDLLCLRFLYCFSGFPRSPQQQPPQRPPDFSSFSLCLQSDATCFNFFYYRNPSFADSKIHFGYYHYVKNCLQVY